MKRFRSYHRSTKMSVGRTLFAVLFYMLSVLCALRMNAVAQPAAPAVTTKRVAATTAPTAPKASVSASAKPSSQDKLNFEKGRLLFANQKFEEAIDEYRLIGKGSARWVLAKEEVGWAMFRLRMLPQALSEVRSLTNDFMAAQIDLEPFLLQGLINLYSCDYNKVFETIKEMKRLMPKYVGHMEDLAEGKVNETQAEAIHMYIEGKGVSNFKPQHFMALPKQFFLDRKIQAAASAGQMDLIVVRLTGMARLADKKNKKMLQHLNLLEVEAIQRAFVPNQFREKAKTEVPKAADRMVFNNDDELWADEIDHLQTDLFKCDSKTGRKL